MRLQTSCMTVPNSNHRHDVPIGASVVNSLLTALGVRFVLDLSMTPVNGSVSSHLHIAMHRMVTASTGWS